MSGWITELTAFDVPEGHHIDLPGGGQTYIREAAGPPGAPVVLLIHGLGATGGLNWFGAFSSLSQHFRVIAFDLRGHGRGGRTPYFRLEDCADDVHAAARELGIDRYIAVGYSMGGPIAMLVWRRHRESAEGLVLAATSRNFQGHPVEQMGFAALAAAMALPFPHRFPILLPPGTRHLTRWLPFLGPIEWVRDELRHHQQATVLQAAAAVGRFNAREWINEIDVPVAVIATTRDRLVPVGRQVKLAMGIPTAVLHPVETAHLQIGALVHASMVQELVGACEEVAARSAHWTLDWKAQPAEVAA